METSQRTIHSIVKRDHPSYQLMKYEIYDFELLNKDIFLQIMCTEK